MGAGGTGEGVTGHRRKTKFKALDNTIGHYITLHYIITTPYTPTLLPPAHPYTYKKPLRRFLPCLVFGRGVLKCSRTCGQILLDFLTKAIKHTINNGDRKGLGFEFRQMGQSRSYKLQEAVRPLPSRAVPSVFTPSLESSVSSWPACFPEFL